MKDSSYISKIVFSLVVSLIFAHLFFPPDGMSQPPQANWISGPQTVDLGKNVAQINLEQNYLFANAEDTRK